MKLVIDNVSKNFIDPQGKQLSVLENVSLTVHSEEFVALVGPSGCGKSTLLNLTAGLLSPSDGSIYFTDLTEGHTPAMGIVFQETGLFPWRSVYENIAFAMRVIEAPRRLIQHSVNSVLDVVGLKDKYNCFPHQLSGGEQQRVAIARAIVNQPAIVIADEPTGNLDPETTWGIMEIFYRINKAGTTIVMATHNKEIVDTMQRRVLTIENGQIIRDVAQGGYSDEA